MNTLPPATLDTLLGNGKIYSAMDNELAYEQAKKQLEQLDFVGVNLEDVCEQLENEGVAIFADSYDKLLGVLKEKCFEVAQDFAGA